jgi:putative restriction endonuclease
MAKAVLIAKIDSVYDDLPEERYHFPKQYLGRLESARDDWIIYYESRRNGGRMVYYATARVSDIVQDPDQPDFYYALVDDFLEFETPVAFRSGGNILETSLLNQDGSVNPGKAQSAVHPISEIEYQQILQVGFGQLLEAAHRPNVQIGPGMHEEQAIFERPIVQQITNRPFRDRAFAEKVKMAYGKTCAFTGLKIINGGGRPEVQAAHIRPVRANGPDSIRNGIAICGTVHWMFDRGLITLSDDYRIVKARRSVPKALDRLLLQTGTLRLPDLRENFPATTYLSYHREHVFKG